MNTSAFELRPEDYRPKASRHKDLGLGIVGCGEIVQVAHLAAYRACGYNVVVACDIDPKALEIIQRDFGVENTTTELAAVLDDPAVQVLTWPFTRVSAAR